MKRNATFADIDRRRFLSSVGKGIGLMAMSSAAVASLFDDIRAAGKHVDHLSPIEAAADEDYWATILGGPSVGRQLAAMSSDNLDRLRVRMRGRLPPDAAGRVTYSATANAVKGTMPSAR